MMTLYGFGRPSRASRVAWALEEAGAEWDYVATTPRAADLLALNPLGKMPALVDGELILTESVACCSWVATQNPDAGLIPEAGTPERARYDRFCSFVTTELEQPLWTKAKHTFVLPEALRVDVRPAVVWEFERAVAALSAWLGDRETLLASGFSCADILCAHTLAWAETAGLGDHLPEALVSYRQRHLSRPAFGRALAREASAQ
ncbi:MAG TPA: glutathione S-transferase family protein [Deltaproteobacteria bacterium]|nr:glutathione S-transferase family protein [Deltaproteobacteria bacterium]